MPDLDTFARSSAICRIREKESGLLKFWRVITETLGRLYQSYPGHFLEKRKKYHQIHQEIADNKQLPYSTI